MFVSYLSNKTGQEFVNGVRVVLPGAWMKVLVHASTATEGAAHWSHGTNLRLAFVAILPESNLLILIREVDVNNEVEVWTRGDALVVHPDKDSGSPGLATGYLADSIRIGFGRENVGNQCRRSVEEEKVFTCPDLKLLPRKRGW